MEILIKNLQQGDKKSSGIIEMLRNYGVEYSVHQPVLEQCNVMRWVEFEKQKPPIDTLVACRYEDGRVDAGEFKTEDDVARHEAHYKPVAWVAVQLPPIA